MVSVPDSLLLEDSTSGNTVGEEEEGVVNDPGTEVLPETDEKVKVKCSVNNVDAFSECGSVVNKACFVHS